MIDGLWVHIWFLFPPRVMYKGGVSDTSCSQKAADKQTQRWIVAASTAHYRRGTRTQVPRDTSSLFCLSSPDEAPSPCAADRASSPPTNKLQPPGRFRYMSSCFSIPLKRMCKEGYLHALFGGLLITTPHMKKSLAFHLICTTCGSTIPCCFCKCSLNYF